MKRYFVILGSFLMLACAPTQKEKPKPTEVPKPAPPAKAEEKKHTFEDDIKQDEAQKLCSNPQGTVSADMVSKFLEEQKKLIKYPANGKLVGDWKKGEQLFANTRKGNCYACHCADPKELACGNIGPILRHYGKTHNDVKYTYEKIYNSWAFVPCSIMYRAGVHGILTPEEIADIVAYLHSPESPVNK
ncbi:MAG: sulfur oxidation c-type cytochrome SoxX [Hydrogenobacter thermophilus]|uniref:sulfur oxidation c-type cytochrome SoxX n=1 Tax=Hydrogenobacter thermophilus TaxID=940 RepID=UPI001C75F85E|nr:sulfur oxidation c-type cytochrome SoxX [Hydrogenobacter thermophilus]QWK19026.1 MAG: sulfur oxidation c-type cytochrome SoxX [Hydrogenobacter thermophilus]